LLDNPEQPAWFLPLAGKLYFRKSQLPHRSGSTGPVEVFRTKCELAVELLREQARILGGKHLAAFDGGFALASVVRPLVAPEDGSPRIEFLTRVAARCPVACPAAGATPGQSEVGQEAVPAPPGRALGRSLARGARLHLRAEAEGHLEGGRVPVAGRGS